MLEAPTFTPSVPCCFKEDWAMATSHDDAPAALCSEKCRWHTRYNRSAMRHRRGTLGNVDAAGNFRINSRERFGMTFGIARRVAGTRAGHGP